MLDELHPPADTPEPRIGDWVQYAGGGDLWYSVVEVHHLEAGPHLELNHRNTHPQYEDWAASVPADLAREVVRLVSTGTRRWTLHP